MQKTPTKIHRMVVFIGLAAAIVLCAFSCIALGRARPPRARPSRAGSSIEELDALEMSEEPHRMGGSPSSFFLANRQHYRTASTVFAPSQVVTY